MAYWLIKSEPFKYSWEQFEEEGTTFWDGVRNYAARLHLRAMKKGDEALFYHSNEGLEVVGVAQVVREAYPDPTVPEEEGWVAVDVRAKKRMPMPVSLKKIKGDPMLREMALLKQSRLSVQPVREEEWTRILQLGGLKK